MNSIATQPIEKEDIFRLRIASREVLHSVDEITKRHENLVLACTFGNSWKGKVRITFMTEGGPVEVYTTVWNVTSDYIGLKGGALLPVTAILDVRF